MKKKFTAVLIFIVFFAPLFGSRALACSEYTHCWAPVKENKTHVIEPESIFWCLKETLHTALSGFKGDIGVCFSPESEAKSALSDKMSQTFKLMSDKSLYWLQNDLSKNLKPRPNTANSWLDVLNMNRITYFWRDINPLPFSILRTGEFDSARARIVVLSDSSKVLYIDEVPVRYLLEVDYLVPSWMSVGGIWLRRISFQAGTMGKRCEYTVSLRSSSEPEPEIDVIHYYYGTQIEPKVAILPEAQLAGAAFLKQKQNQKQEQIDK